MTLKEYDKFIHKVLHEKPIVYRYGQWAFIVLQKDHKDIYRELSAYSSEDNKFNVVFYDDTKLIDLLLYLLSGYNIRHLRKN